MHHRSAEPDNARHTAEQNTGVDTENFGEEHLAVLLLGHSGELPGLVEDAAQNRDDLRQEIARRQQADPIVAAAAAVILAHSLHKEHIAGVDDPKADGCRDHGKAVAQHVAPQLFVKGFGVVEFIAPARKEHKHHRGQVRAGVCQQKARRAQLEPTQKHQVIRQQCAGSQHAVYRHQAVQHTGADKLGTQRAQAAGQHTEV